MFKICIWCRLATRLMRLGVVRGWVATRRLNALRTMTVTVSIEFVLEPEAGHQ